MADSIGEARRRYAEERRLNNGQPSLWAHLHDQLKATRGSQVVHVSAGYYSAISAEIVGAVGLDAAMRRFSPAIGDRAVAAGPLGLVEGSVGALERGVQLLLLVGP